MFVNPFILVTYSATSQKVSFKSGTASINKGVQVSAVNIPALSADKDLDWL
jgi:hypothetical protein